MPPKPKGRGKAAKPKTQKGGQVATARDGGRELRPKKGANYKELNDGKSTAKAKGVKKVQSEKVDSDDDGVSLTPDSSEDDLDIDQENAGGSNTTNSATPDSDHDDTAVGSDSENISHKDAEKQSGTVDNAEVNKQVKKLVGQCLKRYHKKRSKR